MKKGSPSAIDRASTKSCTILMSELILQITNNPLGRHTLRVSFFLAFAHARPRIFPLFLIKIIASLSESEISKYCTRKNLTRARSRALI